MSNPVWKKVHELTEGYPPEFNSKAAYDLVLAAWRMGFEVVRDPEGPARYLNAITEENRQFQQASIS